MMRRTESLPTTTNLPRPPTLFVGREAELAEIDRLLRDPACRLLTLVGPGGIGKTRLAIEVARQHQLSGSNVAFVDLQPLASSDLLVPAIAESLQLPLPGHGDPLALLCSQLQELEVLLVLDNFEHLLDGATVLAALLQSTQELKLLVTSREVLTLREEWRYPIGAMPFPLDSASVEPETYSAVQLFAACARRIRPSFSLEEEAEDVVRICQLVEGMPLAIELAATWTTTLRCRAIVDEVRQSLDFLRASLRNVPTRHQSIQAVFLHSWERLSDEEQSVFKRLSVFRGGFRRDTARAVASASLAVLASLTNKSLIRHEGDGRYHIHELLRQYAAEQLAASPSEERDTLDLHRTYYADFLYQRRQDVTGARQREALEEIAAEVGNIRMAWERAVMQGHLVDLRKAAYTYYHFCDFQGRYLEGVEALERAISRLESLEADPDRDPLLALLLVLVGWHDIRLGRFSHTRSSLERARTMYDTLEIPLPPGFGTDPLLALGNLANILGEYEQAMQLGERAREVHEARGDVENLQIALYILTSAAFARGDYAASSRYAQQGYALTERTGNRWMMAYMLTELGDSARARGEYDEAYQRYQSSYTIKKEFHDPEGMAAALVHMARVAWLQERYEQAVQQYEGSVRLYRNIDDRGGLASALHGLGDSVRAMGALELARRHYWEALDIATTIQWGPLSLAILLSVARWLQQVGRARQGIELLALVRIHPTADHESKQQAEEALTQATQELGSDELAAAVARGESQPLDRVLESMLEFLAIPLAPLASPPSVDTANSEANQALVEPLTEREEEVLALIAKGLTNREIAERLVLALGTVKSYTSEIYSKLQVSSRTQAVARGRELGLL